MGRENTLLKIALVLSMILNALLVIHINTGW